MQPLVYLFKTVSPIPPRDFRKKLNLHIHLFSPLDLFFFARKRKKWRNFFATRSYSKDYIVRLFWNDKFWLGSPCYMLVTLWWVWRNSKNFIRIQGLKSKQYFLKNLVWTLFMSNFDQSWNFGLIVTKMFKIVILGLQCLGNTGGSLKFV